MYKAGTLESRFAHTKSLNEVSPKNALETIIRYFTDSREQKQEQRQLLDAARLQQSRAENQATRGGGFLAGDGTDTRGSLPSGRGCRSTG
ncbi:MAG: hypothetical protein DMF61_25155 [Blastocatellia bacterium AA13]|nr:MAG: hypothetical protein DMF61_25155 [Blastocatellia bacterium AA13]